MKTLKLIFGTVCVGGVAIGLLNNRLLRKDIKAFEELTGKELKKSSMTTMEFLERWSWLCETKDELKWTDEEMKTILTNLENEFTIGTLVDKE